MSLTLRFYGVLESQDSWDPLVVPLGDIEGYDGASCFIADGLASAVHDTKTMTEGWLHNGTISGWDEDDIEIVTSTRARVSDSGGLVSVGQCAKAGYMKIRIEHDDEWNPVQWKSYVNAVSFLDR